MSLSHHYATSQSQRVTMGMASIMSTLHITPHSCHSHIHHDTKFACLMGNGQKATGGLLYLSLRDESEKVRIPAIKSIC